MRVLTVYAHNNPRSFCHGVLERFSAGLAEAGHTNELVDLHAIKFDPVIRDRDLASYVGGDIPADILELMDLRRECDEHLLADLSNGGWQHGRCVASPHRR